MARTLFLHIVNNGMFEKIASDPGSAFMSSAVKTLNTWLGLTHKVSLVGRHESNGCEGQIKIFVEQLQFTLADPRFASFRDRWAHPVVIGVINWHMQNFPTHETGGYTPNELRFGTRDAAHFRLPDTKPLSHQAKLDLVVHDLNDLLTTVRDISFDYQKKLAALRRRKDGFTPRSSTGDLVLLDVLENAKSHPESKLAPRFMGPYAVVKQTVNDLTVKHITLKTTHNLHCTRFKPFYGTYDDAYLVALLDKNQVHIVSINYYTGNPFSRTRMQFNITFADGTITRAWDQELHDTMQFEEYVSRHPVLFPLRYSAAQAKKEVSKLRKLTITNLAPRSHPQDPHPTAWLNLRHFDFESYQWYDAIGFPDKEVDYYAKIEIMRWDTGFLNKRLVCRLPVYDNLQVVLDYYDIFAYVRLKPPLPQHGHIVVPEFRNRYPNAFRDVLPT